MVDLSDFGDGIEKIIEKINDPIKAIKYLQDEDIFVQDQNAFDHNMYYIKYGNYNSGINPYSTTREDEDLF